MLKRKKTAETSTSAATVGYEARLRQMADALRGSMDSAEYRHVVVRLILPKYFSEAFEKIHAALLTEQVQGFGPEAPDEYRAQSIFWMPLEARWPHLKAQTRQSTLGQLVDDAMAGVERDNSAQGDIFHDDRYPDLNADFMLINPPFNISAWDRERLRDDKRWQYGAHNEVA